MPNREEGRGACRYVSSVCGGRDATDGPLCVPGLQHETGSPQAAKPTGASTMAFSGEAVCIEFHSYLGFYSYATVSCG